MKLPPSHQKFSRRRRAAFTLTEMMTTLAIFSMVILGIMTAHITGLKMFEFTKAKLSASNEARATIDHLIQDIRTAFEVRIGHGDEDTFVEMPQAAPQAGSAILVVPEAGQTNNWIRYYWSANNTLSRVASGEEPRVIAHSVSNSVIFTAEDFRGQVLSHNRDNRVIGLTLQFYQLQHPVVPVGEGQLYDFYQLRTKITRRAIR